MKKTISIVLCLCMLLSGFVFSATASETAALRFDADGTFTILQISDPQDDAVLAKGLVEFIEKSIELTQPDLIVLTGDIVEDSRPADIGSDDKLIQEGVVAGDYETTLANVRACISQLFAPLEESGIPYVITQGNNDYKSGITTEDWLQIYSEYPGCLIYDMSADADGHIDMYLPILSSDSDEAAYGLWLLDNGKNLNAEQQEWMRTFDNGNVPGVVFEHVPTEDVHVLFEECKPWDTGAFADGTGIYRLNPEIATGHAEEALIDNTCASQFALWKEKNVVGAFFGHLHTSGFTGTYDGITMGLTYGCQFAKAGPYGVRTIVLNENDGSLLSDLYVYENNAFSLQTEETIAEPANAFEKIIASITNLFKFLFNSISYLLKF